VWSYVYDKADRLTRETLAIDGRSYQTDYAFNPNGAMISQTTPGGRTVSYQPDGLGRATRASDASRIDLQCVGCSRQQGGRASAEIRRRENQEP